MEDDISTAFLYYVCSEQHYLKLCREPGHSIETVNYAGKFKIAFDNGLDLDLLIGDEILVSGTGRINAVKTFGGGFYCASGLQEENPNG
jgi:hypothetical protein